MDFSLQDLGGGSGWGGVSEAFGGNGDSGDNGIFSALENIGVNFAAGAATVGLSALGKSAGVSTAYAPVGSRDFALNSSQLARRPGSAPPGVAASLGVRSNGIVFAGVLLIGGLLVFAAFRRKG